MASYCIQVTDTSSAMSEYGSWVKAPSGESLYHLATDRNAEKTKCGMIIKDGWKISSRLTWWPPIKSPKRKTCMRCRPLN